jgi:hypothetical protein
MSGEQSNIEGKGHLLIITAGVVPGGVSTDGRVCMLTEFIN